MVSLGADRSAILDLLASYPRRYPREAATAARFVEFVRRHPDCLLRSNLGGHLTAAGCVIDPARGRLLLIHHRKLGKWLQPGGHADGETDLLAVARREVVEETGVARLETLERDIFDLDVHPIPRRGEVPEHLHYDVRFLLAAEATAPVAANHEVLDVAWVAWEEVPALGVDPSVLRLVEKVRRLKALEV